MRPYNASSPPHIIFFLVDDQGFNDVGYASIDLKGASPSIDRLANDGITLTNYYSQHLCTPARAALMTGLYPIHTGMQHEVISPRAPWGLALSNNILPQFLSEGGYISHAAGKWHLGFFHENYLPVNRGFKSFLGFLGDQEHYYDHTYPRPYNGVYFKDFVEAYPGKNWTLRDDLTGHYSVDILTEHARKVIRDHPLYSQGAPLFLYMAHQLMHGPLEAPPKNSFTVAQQHILGGIPNPSRGILARMLMMLDWSVEQVLVELRKNGMYDNSLIIYSSDNGGCHFAAGYNAPLRGGKHYLFEGGLRVHGFIHSPLLPIEISGTRYDGLMHISDWLPTILDASSLSHLTPQHIDGVSQWHAMIRKQEPPREEILHNIDNFMTLSGSNNTALLAPMNSSFRAAIRVRNMKLIVNEYDVPWYDPRAYDLTNATDNGTDWGVQDCAIPPSTGIQTWLFNISDDPTEQRNLISEMPEVAEQLRARLYTHMKSMQLPAWQVEDDNAFYTWNLTGYFTPWIPNHPQNTTNVRQAA